MVSLDTTLSVREGIKEIVTTLWEALLLVIFVVFVFLQSFRTTLIPALTVPVSLLGLPSSFSQCLASPSIRFLFSDSF